MANQHKATDFRTQPDLEQAELEFKQEYKKPSGKPRADTWDGWQLRNPPELSSGQPEELTPLQIAERAASEEARKRLLNEEYVRLDREDHKDERWRILARATKCSPKNDNGLAGKELRAWASGWRKGCYKLDEDCPETEPHLQNLWLTGVEDGTKCLYRYDISWVPETPMCDFWISWLPSLGGMPIFGLPLNPKPEKRQRLPRTPADMLDGILRTSRAVVDLEEMKKIWKAYKKNGGKLTFVEIEEDQSYGLKWANGMTAYRIIKKFERLKKRPA